MGADLENEPVLYWIDRADRLVEVNAAWDEFARCNDSPDLVARRIIGAGLWDVIVDPTTRQIFSTLLAQVRRGRRIEYPFRCDAPDRRRDMQMIMTRDSDRLRFESRIASAVPRARQPLLDVKRQPGPELLKICSWCKRVSVGPHWLEVDAAMDALGLFDAQVLPGLTHGMCPDCAVQVMAAIAT